MRVLVFGRSGQVAGELVRRAPADVCVTALGRRETDLMDPGAGARAVLEHGPDVVVNAAAWTAVDAAEADPDAARRLNAEAPAELAEACARSATPFVHLSTDYVFDGSGTRPWRANDPVDPRSVYGRTKLDGERRVLAAHPDSVIVRTSWVFSALGSNFVRTMLRLGAERDELGIVADQVGGPTWAGAIADACLRVAQTRLAGDGQGGVYHFAGAPDASWADFAESIFEQSAADVVVKRIATSEYPTPAARPLNSRLDCECIQRTFGITRPDWRRDLRGVIAELGN